MVNGNRALPGVISLAAAVLTGILLVIGISVSVGGDYPAGTSLAYAATGTSAIAVIGGLAAVILRRGVALAVPAIVLGALFSPLLFTALLHGASSLG